MNISKNTLVEGTRKNRIQGYFTSIQICFNVGARLPLILLYPSSSVKYDGARLLRHFNYVNQRLATEHSFPMPQDSGIDYHKSLNSVLIFMHSREN